MHILLADLKRSVRCFQGVTWCGASKINVIFWRDFKISFPYESFASCWSCSQTPFVDVMNDSKAFLLSPLFLSHDIFSRIFSCRFSVSHDSLVLALVPIKNSLTNKKKISHLYFVVSSSSVSQICCFFNNWIICCVFLPSTWSPEREKQGVGISPEKKINKLSFVKVFGEFAQLFLLVFYRTFPMRVRFGWTEIEDLLLPLSWIIVL